MQTAFGISDQSRTIYGITRPWYIFTICKAYIHITFVSGSLREFSRTVATAHKAWLGGMGIVLFSLATAMVVVVQVTFSSAQSGSEEFENCTTGCSLTVESLLLNSAVDPNTIDRAYVWTTAAFSLQSNGTRSAAFVTAVYANRAPIAVCRVASGGGAELCAVAAVSLELHCANDLTEWTVASERNCSFSKLVIGTFFIFYKAVLCTRAVVCVRGMSCLPHSNEAIP